MAEITDEELERLRREAREAREELAQAQRDLAAARTPSQEREAKADVREAKSDLRELAAEHRRAGRKIEADALEKAADEVDYERTRPHVERYLREQEEARAAAEAEGDGEEKGKAKAKSETAGGLKKPPANAKPPEERPENVHFTERPLFGRKASS